MTIVFTSAEEIEKHLRAEIGSNLRAGAMEAFAMEICREGKLSIGQVTETLELSVYQADGLLQHSVEPPHTVANSGHHRATPDRALLDLLLFQMCHPLTASN